MTEHEKNCLEGASYFTAVRGRGASRVRLNAQTIDEAKSHGLGDGKTMIYAVTDLGSSAHILNC